MIKLKTISMTKKAIAGILAVLMTGTCIAIDYGEKIKEPHFYEVYDPDKDSGNTDSEYGFNGYTVTFAPVALSPISIKVGESVEIDHSPFAIFSSEGTMNYSSSDPSIASVSNVGTITAHKAGTAIIDVRYTYSKMNNGVGEVCVAGGSLTVTVKASPESIHISQNVMNLKKGESSSLTYTITPDVTDNVTWSSSNAAVADVDNYGTVTAKSGGTAVITARTSNGLTDTCTVTVTSEIESIQFPESNITLNIGGIKQLNVIATPANFSDTNITLTVSDTSVISLDQNGRVRALKAGTATVTAETDNGKTAVCTVTVNKALPEGITVFPASETINVNDTLSLAARVTPTEAEGDALTWSSNNTAVATVNSNGVVTAKAAGTAKITVRTSNGKTAESTITVKATDPASVAVSASAVTLEVGETTDLTAKVSPEEADQSVTWTSSDTSVATVDKGGKITAKGEGTAKITAKTSNGKSAVCTIDVTDTQITGVTLNYDSAQLSAGKSFKLAAAVTPADAEEKVKALTWTSSNKSVATVSSKGTVAAKKAGKTTITVKTKNGKEATCAVTVIDNGMYTVDFTEEETSVTMGETVKLKYGYLPSDVKVTFKVGKGFEKRIKIDSKGNVTGLSTGTAIVYAYANDGNSTHTKINVVASEKQLEEARKKFAEDVLYYVNIEREKEGLKPVQLMDELSYLAQIRTDEQVEAGEISHTRPDGTSYATVFKESRTSIRKKAACENLIKSPGCDAETCVKKWMNSPNHRANILRKNITHMGIGVEFADVGTGSSYIVTQLFIQSNEK